jgi:hypothetical protein
MPATGGTPAIARTPATARISGTERKLVKSLAAVGTITAASGRPTTTHAPQNFISE